MNGAEQNRTIRCAIARCGFEVVNELLGDDRNLAERVRSEETSSRQFVREESITEAVARALLKAFPAHVEMTLFTGQEEGSNGADWFWQIEKEARATHAFVQAKRVQRSGFGALDSEGTIVIDGPQLRRLKRTVEEARSKFPDLQAWVATYAGFERADPPCGEADLCRCQRHAHAGPCGGHEPSIWIAQAESILSRPGLRDGAERVTLSVAEVVAESVRLDCLLPCIDDHGGGAGPARKDFRLRRGLPSFRESLRRIKQDPRLRARFYGAMRIRA